MHIQTANQNQRTHQQATAAKNVWAAVTVAALGYFVDIYDLVLFSVVREASLLAIGVPANQLTENGILLINMQMLGMLVGGILWGILGDKKGRLSVLFGSIFMYSAANIANGFVADVSTYAVLRFVAGIGLAGELGAGVTLVSEIMSKENRGIGTTIIASFGTLGAVTASLVAGQFNWQYAYWVGGAMGLALLVLRIGVIESGMFKGISEAENISKGNFLQLFHSSHRFLKYLYCILIGLPIWYIVGILITFSKEFGAAMQVAEPINTGVAVMWTYIGLSVGDLACGLMSQVMRSRKKAIILFLSLSTAAIVYHLSLQQISPGHFYMNCLLLGTAGGYWAVFVTIASEQFGTNIRSTVTTSVPNFVRGAVVPLTLTFEAWYGPNKEFIINSGLYVGIITMSIAFIAIFLMEETFGKDLDYIEK
jgi:MFS family permease